MIATVGSPQSRYAPCLNVLGVGVSAIDMPLAIATIDSWIASRARRYVCVTGVHGIMESHGDATLRNILNQAGLVTPDGMPLVWLGWWHGHRQMERVYGPDLVLSMCAHSVPKGYRNFFFGGAHGVADDLAERLRARFPGLAVVGTYTPPFRSMTDIEEEELARQIAAAAPDILWVGLSTPKQERWMAAHVDRLKVPAMIGVGAAFDFHSGRKRQAPRVLQRAGLEWLFRLASEPRRLWRRYLTNNPRFVWHVLRQELGVASYALDRAGTAPQASIGRNG
jgi:N-acetylglucosaminyldiphosphoundecaprenol N-acetyl-beta-D-mannosaminyltransferase